MQDPHCPAEKRKKRTVHCADLQQTGPGLTTKLPRGLIGSRCTAEVNIEGHTHQCLLDTGSQVTAIPVSFYNAHLQEQQIQPLHDLLHVEGAAGQDVPYLGYVKISVKFPKDFIGYDMNIETLALVDPDTHPDIPATLLIGMNTLEPLYEQYVGEHSRFQPSAHGYRAVLK